MRTAIQFHTLRNVDKSVPELIERVGETALDGVEIGAAETTEEVETIERALERTGLSVAGIHGLADEFEHDPAAVVERHEPLDAGEFVIAWMSPDGFADVTSVEKTATRLDDLAAEFETAGAGLHYHNHDHEFTELDDGRTGFEALIEETETVEFELDVGWVAAAGEDPIELIGRHGDRISLLHLKDADVAAREPVEIGTGDVDIAGCVEAAREAGVEWLIYEYDDPDEPLASLDHGAEFLGSLQ